MKTLVRSYETLSSEDDVDVGLEKGAQAGFHGASPFRWSRAQQHSGGDPPKFPLTVFDQPFYRTGIPDGTSTPNAWHVPHAKFLNETPRLPFPLISLPEAAMLQHFRRERGEEDHTVSGGSFTAKARSGTFSTVSSSQCPRTPLSTYFDCQAGPPHFSLLMPAPTHQLSPVNDSRRRTTRKLRFF